MVNFNGSYLLDKSEKYVEFLTATAPEIGDAGAKQLDSAKALITVTANGDQYNFTTQFGETKGVLDFTLGKPFEETLKGFKIQNTASRDGNKIIISTANPKGTAERTYEFSDSGLTVLYTSTITDVVAKRFYKRT